MPGETTRAPLRADVVVVGGGAAGLYTALVAAREGARVAVVARSPLAQSASYWAQGGIAAALGPGDSPELHARDTLAAGRGAARESAVELLCREAPERVRELAELGVRFDPADEGDELALGLEGGHSAARVVHAGGSATGGRVTRRLSELVTAEERIEVLEATAATGLWVDEGRCVGAVAEAAGDGGGGAGAGEAGGGSGRVEILARATVLATGGAAALWERHTNPPGAVGTGLALAHRAGARLADMELVQFHPTAVACEGERDGFLITEAIRGAGARLLDARGERFVDELAPRDEVALAILARLRARERVTLDMRDVDLDAFPNVLATLEGAGMDPRAEPVPVAPAAHYMIGGVATDLAGRSSLPGLYAVGECACNGVHGANRLASNSLAECFVFGRHAALAATGEPPPPARPSPAPDPGPSPAPPPETRRALWELAGLERDRAGLERLARDPFPLARLIAASALAREESRGVHRRLDRPRADPALDGVHTAVAAGGSPPALERWE